jgi:hypothetical protein
VAANDWLLQDGRSILVEFETATAAKAWGWFGNRSSGEGLEFDAAASAWTDHAWLRGGQYILAAESGGPVTVIFSPVALTLSGQTFAVQEQVAFNAASASLTGQSFKVDESIRFVAGALGLFGQAFHVDGAVQFSAETVILSSQAFVVQEQVAFVSGVLSIAGQTFVLAEGGGTPATRNKLLLLRVH